MEIRLLTGSELAEKLKISRSQAFKLMRTGKIPTVKFGRCVRVRFEDLERFIQKNLIDDTDRSISVCLKASVKTPNKKNSVPNVPAESTENYGSSSR